MPFAGRVNGASEHVIPSEVDTPQVEEDRVPEPVKPLWLVKVRVVDTDWPGAEMVRTVGLAKTVYEGTSVTVSVNDAFDPE